MILLPYNEPQEAPLLFKLTASHHGNGVDVDVVNEKGQHLYTVLSITEKGLIKWELPSDSRLLRDANYHIMDGRL